MFQVFDNGRTEFRSAGLGDVRKIFNQLSIAEKKEAAREIWTEMSSADKKWAFNELVLTDDEKKWAAGKVTAGASKEEKKWAARYVFDHSSAEEKEWELEELLENL